MADLDLRWRDVARELPEPGQTVIATNGHQRWFDQYNPLSPTWGNLPWMGAPLRMSGAPVDMPTHWHPTLDLPKGGA